MASLLLAFGAISSPASVHAAPGSAGQPSLPHVEPGATSLKAGSERAKAPTVLRYWADDPTLGADPLASAADSGYAPPLVETDGRRAGVRGITVGPIESALHPGKGYGSAACERTLDELVRLGATWVSLTPYGRIADLRPTGIDFSFEAPFEQNRRAIVATVEQAHRRGLRVLMVPHLWVEDGGWRGEINPGSEVGWTRWAQAYRGFVLTWAEAAAHARVDMLSVGVELGSWVTTPRAQRFRQIIEDVRRVYSGPITYSANWDDIDATLILGSLDVIGINGFYPLAEHDGAGFEELYRGATEVAKRVRRLASLWHKPVLFTELGYTTRPNPAVKPWEWPDRMQHVKVDQEAQATAYRALLAPLLDESGFLGFFVWRFYADPDDVSQEAEWGFSPRGKLAELVMRDAFRAFWASDWAPRMPGESLGRYAARTAGMF